MPTPKRPHDGTQLARLVVDMAGRANSAKAWTDGQTPEWRREVSRTAPAGRIKDNPHG